MRIAVIGTGVSGLLAARLLYRDNDLTVYEANKTIGGHARTINIRLDDLTVPVDTGFIVFNRKTSPNFVTLLERLWVPWQNSHKDLSISCPGYGLEYGPADLDSLFAQRKNLIRPRFLQMTRGLGHVRKQLVDMARMPRSVTTKTHLARHTYGPWFETAFLSPLAATAGWRDLHALLNSPACTFARFVINHGLLETTPARWLVIYGGSREYVRCLAEPFMDRIRLSSPVSEIRRDSNGAWVTVATNAPEYYDEVVIATHSDQALALLADPSEAEKAILGAIPYRESELVVHTDSTALPRHRKLWASVNCMMPDSQSRAELTYNMNRLQTLSCSDTLCVTVDPCRTIAPDRVHETRRCARPVYNPAALEAQRRMREISGVNHTHYCGAYWGYGLHEDGVRSALTVAKRFDRTLREIQSDL